MTFGNKDKFHFRSIRKEDEEIVRNIIFEILQSYGLPLDIEGADHDLYDIVTYYKEGLFGVVEYEGQVIGSFALYPMSKHEVELRKMYLLPEFRGQGVGKWVISFCEAFAQKSGYEIVSLETASALREAIGLYEKMGYKRVTLPNHTDRCDIIMKKNING